MITMEEQKLFYEVRGDAAAYARLQAKARQEGMSLYAVLREWGDTRKWAR